MFTTSDQLIECVPNFSEGRNKASIEAIANAIRGVAFVKLLHTDIGVDANRTVFTFIGKPDAVIEAAYRAIKVAEKIIDMRAHKGEHPRMGACDVCPLIPFQNISLVEVIELSKKLGKRLGDDGIPVFLYEKSANTALRQNLSYIRKNEYEGIAEKIKKAEWKPDFGPQIFHPTFGIMALGARNFLIAYNINLQSKDLTLAKKIAKEIRDIRTKNDGSKLSNLFQHVKAIGWWMQAYNCTQISTNITDIHQSPIIDVFTAIKNICTAHHVETNGSELIGLIPKQAFAHQSLSIDEAINYLGLNAVKPFTKEKNIIEYCLNLT
ncbi:MAG TPA: glutamate formimidoyltransferase [Chitinophagales bacterium]|nr:glutamate formimidoyltransferase [Chitinophagales bacterium]HMW11628.1 glutamate formimidoyltransferase [Chitinophagales bacterium]HMX60764.1 glutamate formimidoyltransferase [Chitinophagales bacterium]HMY23277.1 glutamate formimidoyltransferase [Chitinophagales bacterium]HMZ34435.1 glutamate formimidoyltransferase [Chitinophagales bacterium]